MWSLNHLDGGKRTTSEATSQLWRENIRAESQKVVYSTFYITLSMTHWRCVGFGLSRVFFK